MKKVFVYNETKRDIDFFKQRKVRAGLKLSKGLHHMQHAKYKIIGITISIICIALMSIIIYDCKERVKKEKQIRKKIRGIC